MKPVGKSWLKHLNVILGPGNYELPKLTGAKFIADSTKFH